MAYAIAGRVVRRVTAAAHAENVSLLATMSILPVMSKSRDALYTATAGMAFLLLCIAVLVHAHFTVQGDPAMRLVGHGWFFSVGLVVSHVLCVAAWVKRHGISGADREEHGRSATAGKVVTVALTLALVVTDIRLLW